ncbi:MAG: ATP-binding cassette domain-containing protein [Gammaproteobacteria bacterium]|nr:MAG: ATP-binding cassette domain-containing protein [Gammaproteobacteria bacterium]
METNTLINAQDINKQFSKGTEAINVLNELDLEIESGDFIALMGASGSGKSTLLNIIAGIDTPTHGNIYIDGVDIASLNDSQRTKWRTNNIGYVFQQYHLISTLNAEKNVELPLLLHRMGKTERKKRVLAALSLVDLEDRAHHKPSELSGGQEQRVGIARAIVTDPNILLCDEPTGNLDRKSGDEILELLQALNSEHGKTIIMVTHDPHAASCAKRILYLDEGNISTKAVQ